jgi:hypothetical protein
MEVVSNCVRARVDVHGSRYCHSGCDLRVVFAFNVVDFQRIGNRQWVGCKARVRS